MLLKLSSVSCKLEQPVDHAQESGLSVKDMEGSMSALWLSAGGQALGS